MYMAGKSNRPLILSQAESEFIDGALLGDGHITKPKGNSCQFSYITSKQSHAEYVYQKLKRMAVGECKNGPIKAEVYDKRTKKTYTSYRFRTINNITFLGLRQRWYPNKIKIIPSDVKLTPTSTLIWYLGDGALMAVKRSYYIKLCTNGFDRTNIEHILFPQLSEYEPSLICSNAKQWWIYLPRRHISKFLSFIGDCPVSEYEYKWKQVEYKRVAYKIGTTTNFSKIQSQILTDHLKGDSMWELSKKYRVDYNLIKYHIKRYERRTRGQNQITI